MRNVLLCSIVAIGMTLAFSHGPAAEAQPSTQPAMPKVVPGDTVRVYLDRARSGNEVYVEGKVITSGGSQICIQQPNVILVGMQSVRIVTRWVPWASTIYLEKLSDPKAAPSTQP